MKKLRLVICERFIRDAVVANDCYADMFVKLLPAERDLAELNEREAARG